MARIEPRFGSALWCTAGANFFALNEGSSRSIPLAQRVLLDQVDAWKCADSPSGRPGDYKRYGVAHVKLSALTFDMSGARR